MNFKVRVLCREQLTSDWLINAWICCEILRLERKRNENNITLTVGLKTLNLKKGLIRANIASNLAEIS